MTKGGVMGDLKTIAVTIGYWFWQCKSDEEAYEMGIDVAREIIKNIEQGKYKEE